jgi:hypothetical protein
MVPEADGSYSLCQHKKFYGWLHIANVNNEEEAKICIANLQRPTIEL